MYNAFILMHRWLLYLLTNGLHNILGRNSCLLLDDGGGNHWLPQIGLRSPWPEINLYWPGQVWCNYPVIIATHHYSLTLGFSVIIPILPKSAQSHLWLLASTCFCWNRKCSTWSGYRSNQSSSNYHQYATLTRPNKTETVVCGSSIFVCWMTGEAITGCHK